MLKMFCPDFCFDNIHSISLEWLQAKNITKIILDVDNTLLPRDKIQPEEVVITWIKSVREAGIEIVLLSNNGGKRLEQISAMIEVKAVSWAVKPMQYGFKKALKKFSRSQGRVLVIGDQLLTDVLGAKRMGLSVLWVRSLSGKEFLGTKITRKLEKVLVRKMKAKGLLPEG